MAVGVSNAAGTNRVQDYNLGRGIIYASELDSTTGLPVGYRDLGNCPSFALSVDVEELIHRSSRAGLSSVDKRLVLSQTINFNFVLEELSGENMGLFFSGETVEATNPAVLGIAEYEAAPLAIKGRWYPIYEQTGGIRAMNLTEQGDVVVKNDAGGTPTTLVHGTDYTVDLVMGMVFLLSSGSSTESETLDITLTADAAPVANVSQTRGATRSGVDSALKFIGENPADADQRFEVELHSVQMSADGDFSLISESDLTQLPISGTAQANANWLDANSTTMTITSYDQ